MLTAFIAQLQAGQSLTETQVRQAVTALTDEAVPAEAKAGFLAALAAKGETVDEIAAFAHALRALSIQPPLDAATRGREILDVCGTGGDRLNTFNISTTVAIVAVAAGVTVAKHGNRAVTSQSGSADVLEALGIRIDLGPEAAAAMLRERRFAFFFAPNYHPAFRHLSPARRLCAERGQRTVFNFLGPLLNPALPSAQLVGVPQPALCVPLARVLQGLGLRRGLVVSGATVPDPGGLNSPPAPHLDEFSTLGPNTLAEFYHDRGFATATLDPGAFPVQPARLEDLLGGTRDANAAIVRGLLRGEDRGPRRDAVLINAAAALLVAGRVRSLAEGWDLAGAVIDRGEAAATLAELAQS